ncbi:hypothetical protein MHU86_3207 [Fragilaria crotonensis]|nr:hypothetical protein MHU86_3207 [Fragilaria crotonensis]
MGAFGWTLSTDLGERSAEGMGPAPGANPNSYRSEAYGMLAMLCFLKRLAEFTYQHEPWCGTLATDSLSLVETVLGIKRKPSVMEAAVSEPEPVQLPLDPLSPEWDLIVNIRRLLCEMPGLSLEHVRGHQDRRGTYQRLSLWHNSMWMPTTWPTLSSVVWRDSTACLVDRGGWRSLDYTEGTVTTKYKTAIRHQATYGPLLAHLQARNGWNASTTERINWKAHAACLHKRIKRRDHYIKLVQEILPTNHRQHRRILAAEGVRCVRVVMRIGTIFCDARIRVERRGERTYSRSLERLVPNGKLVPVYVSSWMVSRVGLSAMIQSRIN